MKTRAWRLPKGRKESLIPEHLVDEQKKPLDVSLLQLSYLPLPNHVNLFFFSSRRPHTIWNCDWSSDVCSSDLPRLGAPEVTDAGGPVIPNFGQGSSCVTDDNLRSEESRVGIESKSRWSTYD